MLAGYTNWLYANMVDTNRVYSNWLYANRVDANWLFYETKRRAKFCNQLRLAHK